MMKATKPNIKAIKTKYDGYRFRSRLEAKWAYFFNTANIKYEYEAEGYATNGVCYLPDFYLPQFDMHVEVKAPREGFETEMKKAWDSIQWGGYIKKLLVLSNFPKAGDIGQWYFPIMYYGIDGVQSGWWTFEDIRDDEFENTIGCDGHLHLYNDTCAKPFGVTDDGEFYCTIEAKTYREICETAYIAKMLRKLMAKEGNDFDEVEKWVPRIENPLIFKALDEARMHQFEKWDN